MRVTLALLAAMIACVFAVGCQDPESANKICADHGGVLSTDGRANVITCGDHITRSWQ